ncbi:GNVR domain-containing protein [Caballeronia concitans]|uniref:Tyrosine-protein kinase involved in EPS biosynthesis n=1 Tax=Caballeronia concitans TaxID=1777133 RepID=A0A658R1X2_9BURK|nr:GNVR domain-containing protein [Caballeronia concitans]KIG08637.1 lipopolysaccharide biosynthesis protein [Burkholderia sp. MR1]SAL40516.1 tyrosine-protein kinase involved in EPS biosynthesis [Caballeronia concitans]
MTEPKVERFFLPTEQGLKLSYYLDLVLSNKALILVTTAVVVLFGAVYLLIAPPTYESNLVIQVEDKSGGSSNLLGDLSSALQLKAGAPAEMEIIKSRLVVSAAVDKLRLYIDARPDMLPVVGRWLQARPGANATLSEPRFGLPGYAWGGETIDVDRFNVPGELEGKRFTLTSLGAGRYRLRSEGGDIDATGEVGTPLVVAGDLGTVELSVTKLVARAGERFELHRYSRLDVIDRLQRDLTVQELGRESDVIGVTLTGRDRRRTAEVLNAIADEYLAQNLAYHALETRRTIDFLNGQLPRLKQQLQHSETAFNTYRNRYGTIDLAEQTKLLLEQSVDAQTKLLELRQKRSELDQRFTGLNPAMGALDKQISTLDRQLAGFQQRIADLPALEQQQVTLVRNLQVDTDLYMNLLNASQQLNIAHAGKIGSVRVVDYAVAAERPVKPKKMLVMVFAVIGGLGIGMALAFLRWAVFDGVRDPGSLEESVGLPVIAQIPRSTKQRALDRTSEGSAVLAQRYPNEPAIESVRSLQVALQIMMLEPGKGLILVTGPSPGVGKSFVSLNLAALLAASGESVALVDCDLRRGRLHKALSLDKGPGLSELLRGKAELDRVIRKGGTVLPDFIACGDYPDGPAYLLMSPRFAEVLATLRARYRYVIVDTPPVLAVADSAIVGGHADLSLMVAREGATSLSELEHSIAALKQGGITPHGIVYNDMDMRRGQYGGRRRYVGYYNYGEQK